MSRAPAISHSEWIGFSRCNFRQGAIASAPKYETAFGTSLAGPAVGPAVLPYPLVSPLGATNVFCGQSLV